MADAESELVSREYALQHANSPNTSWIKLSSSASLRLPVESLPGELGGSVADGTVAAAQLRT